MKKSYLYTNNHFAAKSVVNAVMLKAQLGEPIEGEYPEALVRTYPELQDALAQAASRRRRTPVPVSGNTRPAGAMKPTASRSRGE